MYKLFSTLRTIKDPIKITENAWKKMESIIKQSNNNIGFLFSVNSGGCNGFNYNFNLFEKSEFNNFNTKKVKISCIEKNNIKVYIDPK